MVVLRTSYEERYCTEKKQLPSAFIFFTARPIADKLDVGGVSCVKTLNEDGIV